VAGLVIVDTDLLIDFLRGMGDGVRLVRSLIRDGRLRVTAVTAFELRLGTDFLARRDDILRLLLARTFPLDLGSALHAGEVASTLRKTGQEIGFADCLQAGACLRHDLPLATRNRRHFDRVEGLRLHEG
jgi:tRNA(fMet)-specific endonuclease VapC